MGKSSRVRPLKLDGVELLVIEVDERPPQFPELTGSETEVAAMVLEGRSNKEIAEARGVSAKTVANQLRAIYGKLDICSRYELAALAHERTRESSE